MLDDKNHSLRTQIFTHKRHGTVMRKYRGKYFRPTKNSDSKFIIDSISVDPADVPESMVRTECKRDKHTRVMCAGCGKMFQKIEMDGTLCRGDDGCSINAELGYLTTGYDGQKIEAPVDEVTIYNTLPFDGTGVPA